MSITPPFRGSSFFGFGGWGGSLYTKPVFMCVPPKSAPHPILHTHPLQIPPSTPSGASLKTSSRMFSVFSDYLVTICGYFMDVFLHLESWCKRKIMPLLLVMVREAQTRLKARQVPLLAWLMQWYREATQ